VIDALRPGRSCREPNGDGGGARRPPTGHAGPRSYSGGPGRGVGRKLLGLDRSG